MGIYSPRLWWVAITLLLWAPHTHCREFTWNELHDEVFPKDYCLESFKNGVIKLFQLWEHTIDTPVVASLNRLRLLLNIRHEDIREAMLSLVHMIRMSEDKLERHELREKSLGEQLKKMLNNLDKKHRALEPLRGMISRLDDRLSNVETILLQKEEREKISQVKVIEALDSIQNSVRGLSSIHSDTTAEPNNVARTNTELQKRLDATNAKIDTLNEEIKILKAAIKADTVLHAMCKEQAVNTHQFSQLLVQAETVIKKYEKKLSAFNSTAPLQTEAAPLHEVAIADEAWQCNISNVLENQVKQLVKIEDLLSNAETRCKGLPQREDFYQFTSKILDASKNMTNDVLTHHDTGVTNIVTKLRDMGDRLSTTNEDIQKSLTQSNTMTERAYNDISRSYEMLRTEVSLISKDGMIVQNISDNVLHLKKRLEYGVNQIILQTTEIVKSQHKLSNESLYSKLNHVEEIIMSNQTLALANLSTTLEAEMSQVWRQIGIMHRQIMMSQEALNHLSENTERYVNSSTVTMDKVKDEVDSIKTRMVDLGENVNYVLGKLSLVTQEFKMMASGLHATLQSLNERVTNVTMVEDTGIAAFSEIPDKKKI